MTRGDHETITGHGGALVGILCVAALVAACGGNTLANPDAGPDAVTTTDAAVDDGGVDGATADSGADASTLPPGWVAPRCGTELVDSCADCPGLPFACETCDTAAHCVADCAADCAAAPVDCADNATCVEAADDCEPFTFCGCPSPSQACDQGPGVAPLCVDSCEQDCAADPLSCPDGCGNATDDQGCCPDPGGQVFRCSGDPMTNDPALCHDSCDGCGAGFCVQRMDDPAAGWVECSELGCCPQDQVLCPDTGTCVDTCADCGAQYVGICAVGGKCVTDCGDCSRASDPGVLLLPCDDFCTDVMGYQYHCGDCATACSFPDEICSAGHCCGEDPATSQPTAWCPACNCCTDTAWCAQNDCSHCVP